MKTIRVPGTLIGLIGLAMAAVSAGAALADDGPQSAPAVPSPAMPPDLARHIEEVTDVVLEHHIDPPARQQMVLSGIKRLYRAAGVPEPPGLGRRVSAVATPQQVAALITELWPKTMARPIAVNRLEEALLEGLLGPVSGHAELMTAKERKVHEQFAGNRYVGIHIALGMDEKAKRPMMHDVFEGGPADRAGVKTGDLLEEVDGVDTKGKELRDVVERLRGDEGTEVTITVRGPKETKSRTMTITRGQLPHSTILGVRKEPSGEWNHRLDGPDPIGYVRVTEIAASTPHELRKLAQQMESQGIRALVIDLRGPQSGGVAVHPAVLLADSLLERGEIGRVRTVRGETTYRADPDALFRGWPIAVLVDHGTGGTAEWLAAALQDNHRATLVGPAVDGVEPHAPPVDAVSRSTIAVGDGAWSVSLVTGYLERGDGRPLVEPGRDVIGANLSRRQVQRSVQPDHVVPKGGEPGRRGPFRPGTPDPGSDPVVKGAVAILHQALEKV